MPLPMYADLIDPQPHNIHLLQGNVAESHGRYLMITERHIQAMWLEQKYFRSLKTSDGQPITVISPGIWNSSAGPDFLKAHLLIGQEEVRGDIELHLSNDSWYQHKHHLDNNYNNVVLHISYWTPRQERPLLTAGSFRIPCTYLDTALTIPEARILNLIDLDLYPYTHFAGTGACAGNLFRTLPEADIAFFFRSAAEWRLERKRDALAARTEDPDSPAALGIAMALGYKHNTETFSTLYSLIKSRRFQSEKECFAFSLGLCGFFENVYQLRWKSSSYYLELQNVYMNLHIPATMPKLPLKQNQIRPPSHPVRRLAALAKITSDHRMNALIPGLMHLWNTHWTALEDKKSVNAFRQQLSCLLPSYQDEYWEHHYAFETRAQTKPIALIGDDLKREMIVNVLLPLLHQHVKGKSSQAELEAFNRLYASFPSSKTQKSSYLVHRFFGNAAGGNVLKRIDMQQGAYQLHRDFCIHYEASCQGCPFISRYKEVFSKTASGLLKIVQSWAIGLISSSSGRLRTAICCVLLLGNSSAIPSSQSATSDRSRSPATGRN